MEQSTAPPPPMRKASRRFISHFLIAVAVAITLFMSLQFYIGGPVLSPDTAPPDISLPDEEQPPEILKQMHGWHLFQYLGWHLIERLLVGFFVGLIIVGPVAVAVVVAVVVVVGFVLWIIRRHRSRIARRMEQASEHEYHQKMAEELKAELLRRAEKWEQTHDDRAP